MLGWFLTRAACQPSPAAHLPSGEKRMSAAERGERFIRVGCMTALLSATACATASIRSSPDIGWRPSPPNTIAAGTLLTVQLNQPLSTATSHEGDRFTAE